VQEPATPESLEIRLCWKGDKDTPKKMSKNIPRMLDLVVFLIANLVNILLALLFIYRAIGQPGRGNRFGWASVLLGIPLLAIAVYNLVTGRNWWTVLLPGLMVLYDLLEWIVDHLYKLDFRHSRWLGLYLLVYYLALMGMIGYTFMVGRVFGFFTLITYFINLAATAYSFSRVRHG
jgi:hypothetical protein